MNKAADNTQIVEETVYNAAGDIVAVRNSADSDWTCTSYDARGRVTSVTTPAFGTDTTPRTVTTAYAVNNDARTSTLTDATGTLTTTVDLLDRAVSYTDTHGVVTTTSYDQAGRVTGMVTQGAPGGGGTSSLGYTYRDDGQPATVTVDGPVMATATYDTHGELAGVTYPFGTLDNLSKTPAGALIGTRWTVGTRTFTEELTRSQSGRIIASQWADTATPTTPTGWAYAYDPVGRLTQAVLAAAGARPQVTFGYAFTPTGGCGADPAAGANGARTSSSVQIGTSPAQTSQYCYDHASRLTQVTGANPINNALIAYDPHGNATRIGDQTFTYDATDRVTGTTVVSTSQTLAYTRDVTGRVVQRVATGTETGTTYYGFTANEDSPDFQLTAGGGLAERYLALPGGILFTQSYTAATTRASIPNLHGDTSVQLDLNNAGQAVTVTTGWLNDPYGQPLNQTTGLVDLNNVPQTRTGTGTTDSWLGQHQRGYEHTGGLNQMLMGARTYLPTLGIFTSTDPIQDGNDTTYTYPNDPINQTDLDGKAWHHGVGALLNGASTMGCLIGGIGVCGALAGAALVWDIGSRLADGEDWRSGSFWGVTAINSAGLVLKPLRAVKAFTRAGARFAYGSTRPSLKAIVNYVLPMGKRVVGKRPPGFRVVGAWHQPKAYVHAAMRHPYRVRTRLAYATYGLVSTQAAYKKWR